MECEHIRKYIDAIASGSLYSESEILDEKTKFNEYLMLSLRTNRGISLNHIVHQFGQEVADSLGKEDQDIRITGWIRQAGRMHPADGGRMDGFRLYCKPADGGGRRDKMRTGKQAKG